MKLTLNRGQKAEAAEIAELFSVSLQLNMGSCEYSTEDIEQFLGSPDFEVWVARLEANGEVTSIGGMLIELLDEDVRLDALFLHPDHPESTHARSMLDHLKSRHLVQENKGKIQVSIAASCLTNESTFKDFGFSLVDTYDDGSRCYALDIRSIDLHKIGAGNISKLTPKKH